MGTPINGLSQAQQEIIKLKKRIQELRKILNECRENAIFVLEDETCDIGDYYNALVEIEIIAGKSLDE